MREGLMSLGSSCNIVRLAPISTASSLVMSRILLLHLVYVSCKLQMVIQYTEMLLDLLLDSPTHRGNGWLVHPEFSFSTSGTYPASCTRYRYANRGSVPRDAIGLTLELPYDRWLVCPEFSSSIHARNISHNLLHNGKLDFLERQMSQML